MTEEFKRFATCECRTGWHERCEAEMETETAEMIARLEAKEEGYLYGPNGE
jgi:hypothetical protein